MQGGKVVYEEYPNGGDKERTWELASGTKSFCGIAALCAQEDGLLKLSDRVSDTLTEWKADGRRDITISQLLHLVAGFPGTPIGRPISYADTLAAKQNAKNNTRFQYTSTSFQAFGELLRRKLASKGQSVLDYYEAKIFKPLGMTHGRWLTDAAGNIQLPMGASLSAREWIKFGEMVRLGGKGVLRPGNITPLFQTTTLNPSYALTWWYPLAQGLQPSGLAKWDWSTKLPKDVYIAAGLGGQRLYVVPSLNLTIVRQAPVRVIDQFRDREFFEALMGRSVSSGESNRRAGSTRRGRANARLERRLLAPQ